MFCGMNAKMLAKVYKLSPDVKLFWLNTCFKIHFCTLNLTYNAHDTLLIKKRKMRASKSLELKIACLFVSGLKILMIL